MRRGRLEEVRKRARKRWRRSQSEAIGYLRWKWWKRKRTNKEAEEVTNKM